MVGDGIGRELGKVDHDPRLVMFWDPGYVISEEMWFKMCSINLRCHRVEDEPYFMYH